MISLALARGIDRRRTENLLTQLVRIRLFSYMMIASALPVLYSAPGSDGRDTTTGTRLLLKQTRYEEVLLRLLVLLRLFLL